MDTLQRTIEVERATNLLKGFGWELVESKGEGDELQISFKKTVKPLAPAA